MRGAVTPIVRLLIIVVVDRFFQHQAKNDHEDERTIGRSDDHRSRSRRRSDDHSGSRLSFVPSPPTLTLALLDLFRIDRTNRFRQSQHLYVVTGI